MLEQSLPEYNFKIINNQDLYSEDIIKSFKPDIILWYGWSWIIPPNIVEQYECLCLHPSALPKYRGGSPIQNQIINNEKMSAVTIFKMNDGIDTGDIIKQVPMLLEGNIQEIFNRMTEIGFIATYDLLTNGYSLRKQNNNKSTYFSRRKPTDSEITVNEILSQPAEYLYNKIRMLTDPYPNAYIKDKNGQKVYITNAYIKK
jgi:methionyl-tRNA formyltransferase